MDLQYWTTTVGSFPHIDARDLCARLVQTLDVPTWPQLPRRTFYENMYIQYTGSMPVIRIDENHEKIMMDTTADLSSALETFYLRYLEHDLDAFGLTARYAEQFQVMLETLAVIPGEWAKGQVTGPISFGLTVTDQNGRASLYHDLLPDVIVKNMAMNARWQIQQLRTVRPNVIIFVDEPYMASFGSAYISLSREQVIAMLTEIFDAIHDAGAQAGVHCCGNTDWSVLMETPVDILNLDAYGYMDTLALYPAELRAFLDRGGAITWGLLPNTSQIFNETPESLAQRLHDGLRTIAQKAENRGVSIPVTELAARSLIAPSCGLGPATVEIADHVLTMLIDVANILRV